MTLPTDPALFTGLFVFAMALILLAVVLDITAASGRIHVLDATT